MAFGHGKDTRVYMGGYNLSGYLNQFNTPGMADTAETTVFNSSTNSKTYVPGKKDVTLAAEGFFDGSPGAVDSIMASAFGTSGNVWSYWPQGDALGNYGYGLTSINNEYQITSPVDGAVAISVGGQAVFGRERMVDLHVLQSESTSGSETSSDNTAATTKGGIGYLQVTSAGESLTAKVQHSSAGSSWADLITFTATTGVTAERSAITGSVKRYTRAAWTKASTAANVTFNVGFARL